MIEWPPVTNWSTTLDKDLKEQMDLNRGHIQGNLVLSRFGSSTVQTTILETYLLVQHWSVDLSSKFKSKPHIYLENAYWKLKYFYWIQGQIQEFFWGGKGCKHFLRRKEAVPGSPYSQESCFCKNKEGGITQFLLQK